MRVCDTCGALLVINDVDKRTASHLDGKQHQGFALIRKALDDYYKKKEGERILKKDRRDYETKPDKTDNTFHIERRDQPNRERDRERDRDRERTKERERDTHRERERDTHRDRDRERERDRDRYRPRKNSSRERKRRR